MSDKMHDTQAKVANAAAAVAHSKAAHQLLEEKEVTIREQLRDESLTRRERNNLEDEHETVQDQCFSANVTLGYAIESLNTSNKELTALYVKSGLIKDKD